MTIAYGLCGSGGLSYALTEKTTLGFYYQSKQHYRFKDEVRLENFNGTLQSSQDLRLAILQLSSACRGRRRRDFGCGRSLSSHCRSLP